VTEAEWLTATDTFLMLGFLQEKASDRKVRLFGCECCRRLWHLMPVQGREAIVLSERFADESKFRDELVRVSQDVGWLSSHVPSRIGSALRAAREAASPNTLTSTSAVRVAVYAADVMGEGEEMPGIVHLRHTKAWNGEIEYQSSLLRDIFNPFRTVTVAPSWLTSTVVALARQIYDSRDFSAMPILADALQDAGCDNEAILDHCRGPGPHVRGCWVVDLLLGKE